MSFFPANIRWYHCLPFYVPILLRAPVFWMAIVIAGLGWALINLEARVDALEAMHGPLE